jgi:hypothetical protein
MTAVFDPLKSEICFDGELVRLLILHCIICGNFI